MSITTRIMKLEARGGSREIPIWCDDETDVPASIDAMIAEGECRRWIGRALFIGRKCRLRKAATNERSESCHDQKH